MAYKTRRFEISERPSYLVGEKFIVVLNDGSLRRLEVIATGKDGVTMGTKSGNGDVISSKKMTRSLLSKFTVGEPAKLSGLLYDLNAEMDNIEFSYNKAALNEAIAITNVLEEGTSEFFYMERKEKLIQALNALTEFSARMFTELVGKSPGEISEEIRTRVGKNLPDVVLKNDKRIQRYTSFQNLIERCLRAIEAVEKEKAVN